MSEDEKRIEAASDDKFFLYASDPHRIAAARAQADREKRDDERADGVIEDIDNISRYWMWPAIVGVAVLCFVAVLVAVEHFRATP